MSNIKTDHLMVDLESWGQDSNSVIVQLSAVAFDINTGTCGNVFNKYIDPFSAARNGLKIEPGTVLWWMLQKDNARNNMVTNINRIVGKNTLANVLAEFSQWFQENCSPNTIVWGRGPRFDFGLLTDAYRAVDLPTPWNFRNEMCVRTMEWLRPAVKQTVSLEEGTIAHDGVTDCIYQIKYVSAIYRSLNEKPVPVEKRKPYSSDLPDYKL